MHPPCLHARRLSDRPPPMATFDVARSQPGTCRWGRASLHHIVAGMTMTLDRTGEPTARTTIAIRNPMGTVIGDEAA
jgi:hypothetical protein